MSSIRIVNDNSRLYVVIENPTDEDRKRAMDFVTACLNKTNIKEEKPIDVLPIKVEEPKIVEPKPMEAVRIPWITKKNVFIEWYMKYPDIPDDQKADCEYKLRSFFMKYKKKINTSDIESVKGFLMDFEPIMKETINRVLNTNGYNHLDAFLDNEGNENILAVYKMCIKGIHDALSIK